MYQRPRTPAGGPWHRDDAICIERLKRVNLVLTRAAPAFARLSFTCAVTCAKGSYDDGGVARAARSRSAGASVANSLTPEITFSLIYARSTNPPTTDRRDNGAAIRRQRLSLFSHSAS
ncbi:hypothetical protein EVAR_59641_1 [Eumeta japonica]|uniref:Uncharacterized protein n=1 Tax=Eumeta variegata TaxID=151549 RepID=A0A4C1YF42_EUMVA|nr:hypothetical protein EVAR_59641_1 [Eumeta japonica]